MATTINWGQKDSTKLQQHFAAQSLLQGRLESDLEFMGAQVVRVYTMAGVDMNDYNMAATDNRYGTRTEVGDSVQELKMTQDKSFSATIDKLQNVDLAVKKTGQFVRVQTDEKLIPMKDKRGFYVLSHQAGYIVGTSTAISAANVIARMSAARSRFVNKSVPLKGRTWYVRSLVYDALVETDQFKNLDTIGSKALVKGQIGELFGSPVVEVPDDLMPAGVNFVYVHRSAGTSPSKIEDIKSTINPPGLNGTLIEGRFYWDTFVFGAKADGVYVDVTTGGGIAVGAVPTIAPATGAITVASGYTAFWTKDGSDPRYSASAVQGAAPAGMVAGDVIKAYQTKPGDDKTFASPVAEVVYTG